MESFVSIKILFVEDNPDDVELINYDLTLAGIKTTIRRVALKKDFLFELENFQPDAIISDYSLPMFNGMHAFRLFKEKNISIPFILLTGTLDEQIALECLREGIDDVILKSGRTRLPTTLLRSIELKKAEAEHKIVADELEKSKEQLKLVLEDSEHIKSHQGLSNREFEILCLIASGKSIKEIAAELFLSPATIATYRARILEKMNLTSNVGITLYALRNKLIK